VSESEFPYFIEKLKQKLQGPLPGKEAQIKMAPKPIDERRFNEDPNKPPRLGGVMVLLYPDVDGIHIPLMKRPLYDGAHSGQISFPGGKLEEHDDDLLQTALRETEEEIGVAQNDIEILGQLSELFIVASNFKVLPTVGVVSKKPLFIPDPVEVEEVIPMKLDLLKNASFRKIKEMHFPPYTIFSPYFDVSGEVVWGATAMMLSELATLMEDI